MVNKKTGETDTLVSAGEAPKNNAFNRYLPARYDALSRQYLLIEGQDIDVTFGNDLGPNGQSTYRLSLGYHTYSCSQQKVLSDWANILYGDDE